MNRTTNIPLTQSQMMIWMGQKLNPNAPLYNMVFTFELNGKIEVDSFQKAFQKLIDTTDILRSVIQTQGETPYQLFHDKFESPLKYIDFSTNTDAYEAYRLWVEKSKLKLFDISTELYESVLFNISDSKYIWYLNLHHLITDFSTIKLIYDVMGRYYQQMLESSSIADKTDYTFESYALENSFKSETEVTEYWKQKLDFTNTKPSLYGTKSDLVSSRSNRVSIDLGYERTQQLRLLTEHPDIKAWTTELALSNLFLAILSALVFKIGDKETFILGVPYQNRGSKKEKRTAGLFMQLLPLNIEVDGNDTLLEVISKVKNESLEVMKNSVTDNVPAALLNAFNVVLNFIPITLGDFAGIPVDQDWLLADHVDSNHHIRLQIHDFNNTGNYKLQFDLNHDVFDTDEKEFVTQHFIKVVDAFIVDKNQTLNELSIITKDEIEKIEQWNDTTVLFNKNETLLTKFEATAGKFPDATALVFREKKYSYKTLNEKANQVAHFLITKDVKPNNIVALSLERSFEMMVCIYGILKAGAAYLPIDTNTPDERIRFIANDAAFKTLLFNHTGIKQSSLNNVACFDIREIENQLVSMSTSRPEVFVTPEDLAYVIYTSGSTGEPKGVTCHHKGICNRLNWMNSDYPINEQDTLIQKTPLTFDVSLWELFWPLQVGAKLLIEIPEGHKDPHQLIETINKNKVSVIHFVPSMLNVFIDILPIGNCSSLKKIFCSGEALPLNTVEQAYEKLDLDIYNLYGPTEATVDVTSWHCAKDNLDNGIAIGYPVANTKIYVIDELLNLVPIGLKGELCIGGDQVASGYLNRKELTSEKFVPDLFSKIPDAKMYRTGDIARYRTDGAIEYIGRNDDQVKLRGIRIELGEIERILERNLNLPQVVVIVDAKDNLIAFYTGDLNSDYHNENRLGKMLPNYMIPAHFENIENFPLTKNGKVDKSALKALDTFQTAIEIPFVAPDGDIEELLAEIWKEVLRLKQVSVHDNFIALGGHSLAAIRVTARINEEVEMKFSLNKIFEFPTIKEYAGYLEDTLIKLLNEQG